MSAFLADLILVTHLAFIVFAMFGALCALRWAWAPLVHLPAVAWAAYVEISSGVCPLTPLENSLRRAAGEAGYAGSFLEHYLVPIVYPADLTPSAQSWLGAGLLGLNVLLYARILVHRRRARRSGRRTRRRS